MTNESPVNTSDSRKNDASQDAGLAGMVQDAAQKLGSQAADASERVYRQAVEAGKTIGSQVEEQPWTALAAAAIVALAVGFVLGRSSVPEPRTARDYVNDYLPRSVRRR